MFGDNNRFLIGTIFLQDILKDIYIYIYIYIYNEIHVTPQYNKNTDLVKYFVYFVVVTRDCCTHDVCLR